MLPRWLRPEVAPLIGADVSRDWDQRAIDQVAVVVPHEIEIRRIARRDHSLAEIHHLRQVVSESLTTMRRDQAVRRVLQGYDLLLGHHVAVGPDVRRARNGLLKRAHVALVIAAVEEFQVQHHVV